MTTFSGVIWGRTDSVARREGGFYVTTGQLVYLPTMSAQARAEVKRIKERGPMLTVDTFTQHFRHLAGTPTPEQERRAADMLSRGLARRDRNSFGLGG